MTFFENVELLPVDPIFGLMSAYAADNRKNKVNLGAGVYKSAELKPLILNTVKKAEKILIEEEKSKDYLPIDGEKQYIEATKQLVFGDLQEKEKLYGAQVIGATSGLYLGGSFLKRAVGGKIFLPEISWQNHHLIFSHAGLSVQTYPYYSYTKNGFDFDKCIHFLKNDLPEKSTLLLHGCCHNPTGSDPSLEEWKKILDVIVEKRIFPFFDFSYQGFGTNLDQDAAGIRLFASSGIEMGVTVSHAKNFGLYGERPGALFFLCKSSEHVEKVGSQIKTLIRGTYSNPSCHGARIVTTILGSEELKKHWMNELDAMRGRIDEIRKNLVATLHLKLSSKNFDFILRQKGMFSFTGIEKERVEKLVSEFAIYMPTNGRINLAGLNTENMGYVTDSIAAVYN